jgi:hypothetical protein
MSEVEYLSNALVRLPRLLQVPDDLDERARLRDILRQCDPRDPMVASLARVLSLGAAAGRRSTRRRPLQRLQIGLRLSYRRLVRWRWFERLLVVFMLVQALSGLLLFLVVAFLSALSVIALTSSDLNLRQELSTALAQAGWPALVEIAASLVSAGFVIVGAVQLRRKRLAAYGNFLRATLVGIFFGQVFAFYHNQLWAVWMLAFQIFIASALHFLIRQEGYAAGRLTMPEPA